MTISYYRQLTNKIKNTRVKNLEPKKRYKEFLEFVLSSDEYKKYPTRWATIYIIVRHLPLDDDFEYYKLRILPVELTLPDTHFSDVVKYIFDNIEDVNYGDLIVFIDSVIDSNFAPKDIVERYINLVQRTHPQHYNKWLRYLGRA